MSSSDLQTSFKHLMHTEGTMKEAILSAIAEMMGTGILIFLGCMGCVGGLGLVPQHIQITLNFGLAVMMVVQIFGHISHAHVNPAITVGAVVLGKKTIPEALLYFLGQFSGAVLGYGLLKTVTPYMDLHGGNHATDSFCVTKLHGDISAVQGLLLEGVATGILMLIACAVWDPRNSANTDSVALRFGLAVTGLATAVGPYTGCSMNPVRSFAPALWNDQWTDQWIYWFGPIGGSLLVTLAYKSLFAIKPNEQELNIPEAVALNSVESQKAENIS